MDKLELPDGAWAQIRDKKTVTERQDRLISRALTKMLVPSGKLRANVVAKVGDEIADAEDGQLTQDQIQARGEARMEMYALLNDQELDDLEGYDAAVTAVMTFAWSFVGTPITPDSVLALPRDTFKVLAKACMAEWDKRDDFSLDAGIDDPKAVAPGSDA
jgi:hypothetical protein